MIIICASVVPSLSQEPRPGPARSVTIPAIKETTLKNGLTVSVVEKRSIPMITVQLLIRTGAYNESLEKAGLADLTTSMLTKGTRTRSAEQIAQEIEFLGGGINSGAGWNSSAVTIGVTSDKIEKAMSIMADVVRNPTFPRSELDLLKTQAIDGLTYNLTQPGFIAGYVASRYTFNEHPAGGTTASIESIAVDDLRAFYNKQIGPRSSVLIFAGDISAAAATQLAEKYFGSWASDAQEARYTALPSLGSNSTASNRLLVIDVPDSGQAAVTYARSLNGVRRFEKTDFYPSAVLNSLLGGGYSSRLNQEIRIKRGLSYGAGSGFAWRPAAARFTARAPKKNESAPEVAELMIAEVNRLTTGEVLPAELDPRKAVLTGGFGRNIETTGGLVNALADLYTFDLPNTTLNSYVTDVGGVTDAQIRDFAKAHLLGGDIIIVGDYSKFKADLAKRFPDRAVNVIPVAELDITRPGLRKTS